MSRVSVLLTTHMDGTIINNNDDNVITSTGNEILFLDRIDRWLGADT